MKDYPKLFGHVHILLSVKSVLNKVTDLILYFKAFSSSFCSKDILSIRRGQADDSCWLASSLPPCYQGVKTFQGLLSEAATQHSGHDNLIQKAAVVGSRCRSHFFASYGLYSSRQVLEWVMRGKEGTLLLLNNSDIAVLNHNQGICLILCRLWLELS